MDLNGKGGSNTSPCVIQWKQAGDPADCWPQLFQVQEGETLIRKYFLLKKKISAIPIFIISSGLWIISASIFIYRKERTQDLDYKKTLVKGWNSQHVGIARWTEQLSDVRYHMKYYMSFIPHNNSIWQIGSLFSNSGKWEIR